MLLECIADKISTSSYVYATECMNSDLFAISKESECGWGLAYILIYLSYSIIGYIVYVYSFYTKIPQTSLFDLPSEGLSLAD